MDRDTIPSDKAAVPVDPPCIDEPQLRIHLLGEFRVSVNGHLIPATAWKRRKAESLLKLLALTSRHSLHREQIIEYLWPESDPDAGIRNLRYTLHVARRILAAPGAAGELLHLRGEQLTLGPDGCVWVDAEAFEAAAERARRAGNAADYDTAIRLYAGDLLPENRYDDWVAGPRERLRELYLGLLLEHACLLDAAGAPAASSETLQRIVAIDPIHEEARVGLMRLYARGGRRQQALRQYHQLTAALREEFDIEPAPATQQLYLAILTGQDEAAVPPASVQPTQAPSKSHNLPPSLSTFIGRERELEQLRTTLDTARLITLTGTGGSGKTRLAVEVGRSELGRFPDGVWFVDLANLSEPGQVAQVVVSSLELTGRPDLGLAEVLSEKRLLLILDNCEHLIDACAGLATDLLAGCPRLHILATSREALRVPGERVWRVSPLAVPDEQQPLDRQRLAENESVRLFIARVRAVQPEFVLTDENAVAVVEICRRLDGLPLALELAAARVPALGVVPLADRLENALQVLSSGSRAASPRQQTLRATLDWSHALLDESEQRLFRWLAVFANGWTLDAAEELGAGEPPGAIVSLLAQLFEKSLVLAWEQHGRLRYRMLAPVRQYALELLAAAGDHDAIRRRHAELLLAFAEAAEPKLRGPQQALWIERMEAEHDNLRAALGWAQQADPPLALRLAVALGRFWYLHGECRDGASYLRVALTAAPDAAVELRARALYHSGILAAEGGEDAQAALFLEDALALYRELDDPGRTAAVLNSLGVVERQLGDLTRARGLLEESLAIRRELGDAQMVDIALGNLALLAWSQGDLAGAEVMLEETRLVAQQTGDDWSSAIAAAHLGRIAWERRQFGRALDLFAESLTFAQRVGDQGAIAEGLEGLAGALASSGDPAGAARLWGSAEALRETLDLPIPAPERAINDRMVASAVERLDAASFASAWAEGKELPIGQAVEEGLATRDRVASALAPPAAVLSPRQLEIALLIAGGQTNQQIAATLGIAVRTADTHVGAILRKLGVASRAQVRDWVIERGLLAAQDDGH